MSKYFLEKINLDANYFYSVFTTKYLRIPSNTSTVIHCYRLKFLGCITTEPTTVACDSYSPRPGLATIKSNDATKYRHFAVDTTTTPIQKKIIYFCDLNPYRSGMFCYCSIRKWEPVDDTVAVEANTWSGNFMVGFTKYFSMKLKLSFLCRIATLYRLHSGFRTKYRPSVFQRSRGPSYAIELQL